MKNIKIREKKSKNIKSINKNSIVNDKLKYSIVEIKNKTTKSSSQEENIIEYGSNKINNITAYSVDKGFKEFNRQGQKVFIDTKNNIQKSKIKIKSFKNKLQNKRSKKNTGKKVKTSIKTSNELINKTEKVATPGNQHWVAVIGIDGNNITMIDPGSNQKDMWSAYEFNRTSQFNYFSTH